MRVDGRVLAKGTTPNTGTDVLSKLNPGDTIRAQVLENSGNELTLKLADGSKVSARAMTPVAASEGEFVNFVYKGTVDGKPALEVATSNALPQVDTELDNIRNTLTNLKLPVTDKNIELAKALKEQNLPVTADSMSKIMELVSKNTDLKPASAAFLTAANMSSDKNNIEKLQSLLAGRLKISNDIGELVKLINGNSNSSTTDVKSTVVNNILEKLAAEMVTKGMNQATSTVVLNKAEVSQNAKASNSTNPSATTTLNTNSANISTTATANTNSTNTNTITTANTNSTNISTTANTNSAGNPNIASMSNATNAASTGTAANNNSNSNNTENPTNTDIKGSSNSNSSNVEQQISNLLKGGEPLGKADLPLLSSLSSKLESMLSRGAISAQEQSAIQLIAKEIGVFIFKIQGNEAASKQVVSSSSSLKSFEDAVNNLKTLFVRIDQNSDEINPVKLYKNMDNLLHTLKSSIQQLPMAIQEAAMNIANNLESNVNFINQLNNYSSYVQIPLSIFNQNTTGELYMLKKGSKTRKLDPSKMTILISLDSNNIGRIDTLLSVDKKNISTNFRLESSEIFDVLKENHKFLYKSLLEKGYRLVDFTYRLMDEPINIVNFEVEAKKEFIKSPNNIDISI